MSTIFFGIHELAHLYHATKNPNDHLDYPERRTEAKIAKISEANAKAYNLRYAVVIEEEGHAEPATAREILHAAAQLPDTPTTRAYGRKIATSIFYNLDDQADEETKTALILLLNQALRSAGATAPKATAHELPDTPRFFGAQQEATR